MSFIEASLFKEELTLLKEIRSGNVHGYPPTQDLTDEPQFFISLKPKLMKDMDGAKNFPIGEDR